MNEQTEIPAVETAAPEAPEQAAEKARRVRTMWPIHILRCADGGMFPVKDAPEFAETRDAVAWMTANTPPGELYMPARHPDKAFRQTMRMEEVSPW